LNQATLDHNYEWIKKIQTIQNTHTQAAEESSSNPLGFGDIKAYLQHKYQNVAIYSPHNILIKRKTKAFDN